MRQIKMLYIFVPNLQEVYLLGKKKKLFSKFKAHWVLCQPKIGFDGKNTAFFGETLVSKGFKYKALNSGTRERETFLTSYYIFCC